MFEKLHFFSYLAAPKVPKVSRSRGRPKKAEKIVAVTNAEQILENSQGRNSSISKKTTVTTVNETRTDTIYSIEYKAEEPPIQRTEYHQVSRRTSVYNLQQNSSPFDDSKAIVREREDFDFVEPIGIPLGRKSENKERNESLFDEMIDRDGKKRTSFLKQQQRQEKIVEVQVKILQFC